MVRVILDQPGVAKHIADLLKRDVFLHHLLMRMLRDANRVTLALFSKARRNGCVVLMIDILHENVGYRRRWGAASRRTEELCRTAFNDPRSL